jgi:hypothetical protein
VEDLSQFLDTESGSLADLVRVHGQKLLKQVDPAAMAWEPGEYQEAVVKTLKIFSPVFRGKLLYDMAIECAQGDRMFTAEGLEYTKFDRHGLVALLKEARATRLDPMQVQLFIELGKRAKTAPVDEDWTVDAI